MTLPRDEIFQLLLARTGQRVASQVSVARTLRARMVGLLGRRTLSAEEALLIPRCNSIHMWGMRICIDACFVDRKWQVVALYPRLSPGRIVWFVRGAAAVVEMAEGAITRSGLRVGDELHLVKPQPVETAASMKKI